jgi:hypothetical protein
MMTRSAHAENPVKTGSAKPASFITSLLIGIVLFVLLLGAAELLTRRETPSGRLNVRSVGIYHSQFEIKWFKLQDYVRRNGGVDVLLIGNSMVNTGIDPKVLAREYEKLTGESLRIFNFGVEGLTVAPDSDLVKVLVEQYHPGSIVFVTEMRDYTAQNGLEVEQQLLSNEWLNARISGKYTLRSWFEQYSTALQKLLVIRNWSRYDFLDNFLMSIRRYGDTSAQGYEADRNTGENIDVPPDPNDPKEKENFALFSNYSMDAGRLADLEAILAYANPEHTVFVTELPIYPTYFVYFGGEAVHAQYLAKLESVVQQHGGVFLPPVSWELIPMEDRVDHHHLNYLGAPLYSELLAQQLADACLAGQGCLVPALESGAGK